MSLGMGWHLKKEVTVGQIITLMTILVSGLWWASTVETRLAIVQSKTDQIADRVVREEQRNEKQFNELKAYLIRIDNKMDRLK